MMAFIPKSADFIVFIHILCIILFFEVIQFFTPKWIVLSGFQVASQYCICNAERLFYFVWYNGWKQLLYSGGYYGSLQRQKRNMVYFCSIQKLGRRNKKKNETGIFYKTRDIRLGTRVYCQKYWKSSLSAVQWAPWRQLQPWRSAGSGCRRPSCFFRFFSRLLPQKRSCETGNYIVRNVIYNSAIGDVSAGGNRCWNSFVFNVQSSLNE